MKRLLLITHKLSRDGAPRYLLGLARWLKEQRGVELTTIAVVGGALAGDFEALGKVLVLAPPSRLGVWRTRLPFFLRGEAVRRMQRLVTDWQPELICSNTLTNGRVLGLLPRPHAPVLTISHELAHWTRRYGARNLQAVKRETTRFLATSEAGRKFLLENVGVPEKQMSLLPGFTAWPPKAVTESAVRELRAKLGIAEGTPIIGGIGHESWRKGRDLFVDVGRRVHRQFPHAVFLWIGGKRFSRFDSAHGFRWVASTNDIETYYALFTLFLSTSREDTFPRVVLETASYEVPSLCFAGSGGAPEFVGGEAANVIARGDTAAMAERVCALLANDVYRREMGKRYREKVARENSEPVIAPLLYATLEETAAGWRNNMDWKSASY